MTRIQTSSTGTSITLTGMVSELIHTAVTDIRIEKSFRIIYDSLTARGCRRFPIVPFRLTTRDSVRNQPPLRKTIRTNVLNYRPAVALRAKIFNAGTSIHQTSSHFSRSSGTSERYTERLRRKFYEWWWPCGVDMTSMRKPEVTLFAPLEPLHRRNYRSYRLRRS